MPPRLRDFLRFAAVSGLGWILDTALTLCLFNGGVSLFPATLVGGTAAGASVFLFSRKRIFGAPGRPWQGLAVYLTYTAVMIIIAGMAITALAGLISQWITGGPVFIAGVAKVVVTPALLALNFTMARAVSSLFQPKLGKPFHS